MLSPDDVHNAEFARSWRRSRSYDEDQVDEFLDRVDATLSGKDAVTAHEALSVKFSPRKPGKRAYKKSQVDAFLDKVALTLLKREVQQAGTREETSEVVSPSGPAGESPPDRKRDAVRAEVDLPRSATSDGFVARSGTGGRSGAAAQRGPAVRPGRAVPPAVDAQRKRAVESVPVSPSEPARLPRQGVRSVVQPSEPGTAQRTALDMAEVDAFMDRVEATLRGEDALTAHEVLNARFNPPPPGLSGYQQDSVVAFLAMVSRSIQHLAPRERSVPQQRMPIARAFRRGERANFPELTPEVIRHVVLSTAIPDASGYHEGDVDDFLDRVEETLRGTDALRSQEVSVVQFRELPGGHGGYDQEEVELLLGIIEDRLDTDAAGGHV